MRSKKSKVAKQTKVKISKAKMLKKHGEKGEHFFQYKK